MFSYYDQVKNTKQAKIVSQTRQNIYENQFLTELAQIIELDNFPEDLDQQLAKMMLIKDGVVGLYKEGEEFYICNVTQVGFPRKDGRPNRVIAKYIAKGKNNEYEIKVIECINDKDIVLWYNTDFAVPDFNTERYAHTLAETDKSIDALIKYSRAMPIVRVKDDVEKQKVDNAIKNADTDLGNPQTYIDDSAFDELFKKEQEPIINLHNVSDSDKIQYLSHLHCDLVSQFHSIYGLSNTTTSKQAQQSVEEVQSGLAESWLIPLDMLKQAKEFCDRVSKCFSLEMSAHFGIVHEMYYNKFVGTCTQETDAHEDICNDKEREVEENENSIGDLEKETGADNPSEL